MSGDIRVIRVHDSVRLHTSLLQGLRDECTRLNLPPTPVFRLVQPLQNAVDITRAVQNQVCQLPPIDSQRLISSQIGRQVRGRNIYVTFPGNNTPYIAAPCVAVPIRGGDLPSCVLTRDGRSIEVHWVAGQAWEIREDIRMAPVSRSGGMLLLIYLRA